MRQLEEALHLLAEQDPSVDPVELIDRIDRSLSVEGVPVVALQGSRIMQTRRNPLETTRRGVPRRAWVFAAALAAVVMAIGVPVLLFGGDDPGDVVSAPVEVFDLQTDSFCEWFTAEDMNEIFTVAQQRAGTAYDFEEFTPENCEGLSWRTPGWTWQGSEPLSVRVHFRDSLADDEEENPGEFVGYPHRLLDDKVSYQIRTYQFAWGPGVDGYLRVEGHEDEILYFGFGVDEGPSEMTPKYEELGLAVANELLQRMNWIDSGE